MKCHEMSVVSQSFLSDFAGGIPEVRNSWLRGKGTLLHGARDVGVGTRAAEAARPMPWPGRNYRSTGLQFYILYT